MRILKAIAKPFVYLYNKLKSLLGYAYRNTDHKFKESSPKQKTVKLRSTEIIDGVHHPKLTREEKRLVDPHAKYRAIQIRGATSYSNAYSRLKTRHITELENEAYSNIGVKKKK